MGDLMSKVNFTVLIADRDSKSVNNLTEKFQNERFRVFAFDSGKSVVSCIRKRNVDAAIIDVNLKDLEGYKIVPLIKDINKENKVMITTHENSSELESKCRETGIIYYDIKPLNLDDILDTVKKAVIIPKKSSLNRIA